METSLRYGVDSKALRIHAKEKFPIASTTFLQVHGELDTRVGVPSHLSAMIRHFYPDISASFGVGLRYNNDEKVGHFVSGKRAFPFTNDGLLSFILKGRCDFDQELEKKTKAAAELSWSIFNFQNEQDVRLKIGYEVMDTVPYLQIRESNWTLNADANGKWNVKFNL